MKRVIVLLVVALILCQIAFVLIMARTDNLTFLDLMIGYSFDTFKTQLDMYLDSNNTPYVRLFYLVDTIFPIAYGSLLGILLYLYTKPRVIGLAFLTVGFDYIENGLILMSYQIGPRELFYTLLSIVTIFKFILLSISIMMIIIYYRQRRHYA